MLPFYVTQHRICLKYREWSPPQENCVEARNTTVLGTQQYFTLVRQRYKHGGEKKLVQYFPESWRKQWRD